MKQFGKIRLGAEIPKPEIEPVSNNLGRVFNLVVVIKQLLHTCNVEVSGSSPLRSTAAVAQSDRARKIICLPNSRLPYVIRYVLVTFVR